MYDFGMRLKELRKNKKLTQEQVAKHLNIHKSTIYNYENNFRTPSIEMIVKFSTLYHTSTDYILGLENKKNVFVDDISDEQFKTIQLLLNEFKKNKR